MSLSINISPNKGFAKGTNFLFTTDSNTLKNYSSFLWNFGDGGYSRNPSSQYVYREPGTYTVTLNAYKTDGTVVTTTSSVNISLYLNESIYFDTIPPATFAGHLNRYPFRVNITSSSTGDHYVDLGAQFSKSYEYQIPENKWSFLRPQWRFLDLSGNQVDFVKTTDTPIKIDNFGNLTTNGNVVGVTGTAEFYFVDDLYNLDLFLNNQAYSTIIATLQTSAVKALRKNTNEDTPSFSNSLAIATLPHVFTWRDPDYIKITENGSQQISKIKFTNQDIPLLINFGFSSVYLADDYIDGNGVKVSDINQFAHYIPSNNLDIVPIELSAFNSYESPINLFYSPSSIVFQYEDINGFKTGGYYKGSFYSPLSSTNNYIKAYSKFYVIDKVSRFFNPILWISNPNAGMVATTFYFKNTSLDVVTENYLDKAHFNAFEMPIITNADFFTNSMATSGYHGINCIAALPSPNYHAWMADSELNTIYRVSPRGEILKEINLTDPKVNFNFNLQPYIKNQSPNYNPNLVLSPVQIALDGDRNLWVTLHDTPQILKFDAQGNYLLTSTFNVANIVAPTTDWWNASIAFKDTITDNDLIKPTGIDTDLDNNVWVTYSSVFSGWLIKYDTNGIVLTAFPTPYGSSPQELICDSTSNIWVVFENSGNRNSSYIEKRDSTGYVLSSFGPFNSINHITLDVNQNPWFTYSYNHIASIDNKNGIISTLQLKDGSYSDDVPEWFDANENADITALEGISTDFRNNIYVINSIENKIFVVDGYKQQIKDTFVINPKGFIFSLSAESANTEISYDIWNKSAQATGDWSAFRWINKYATYYYNNTSNYFIDLSGNYFKYLNGYSNINYITGEKKDFSLYDNNVYDLFKINENFDLAAQMKSIAFQPSIRDSANLFDVFLTSIYGNSKHEDLGVSAYEKISNFVLNQSDIDTCNVNALYDMANSVDLNSDDFRLNYPIAIQKSMDLLSINQSRLFGQEVNDSYNFKKQSDNLNLNRGNLLDASTYSVSAGTPVVLKSKSLDAYKLIQTGPIDFSGDSNAVDVLMSSTSSVNYTLYDLASNLKLGLDWQSYYEFYSYLPMTNISLSDNIIDWDNTNLNRNDLLTFFKTGSSSGSIDTQLGWNNNEGIMEFIFTYQLYKGLGLI